MLGCFNPSKVTQDAVTSGRPYVQHSKEMLVSARPTPPTCQTGFITIILTQNLAKLRTAVIPPVPDPGIDLSENNGC